MFEATGFKDIFRANLVSSSNDPRKSMDLVVVTHMDGSMDTW